MIKKHQIGIIGYGNFSKVLIEHLYPYADIVVHDRRHELGRIDGVQFVSVERALSRAIVIPSIPSQFFESFFADHQTLINPQALIVDVCSVKVNPLQTLERLLPATCEIIGAHPMFGPASIARNGGIEGLPIALCPVRADDVRVAKLRDFLADALQLKVIETTPEQHDKEMAYVQGLSHYIGRVMDIMRIPQSELRTAAYEDLLDMKRIQGGDSWELFMSIMHENPYAQEVHQEFERAQRDLDRQLGLLAPL